MPGKELRRVRTLTPPYAAGDLAGLGLAPATADRARRIEVWTPLFDLSSDGHGVILVFGVADQVMERVRLPDA